MKAQILIVKSNDSNQINRIKSLFEAKGHQVAVMNESGLEIVNDEFATLPINQKFPHVFKVIGSMQKKEQKTQSKKR